MFTLPAGYRPAGSYVRSIVRAGSGVAMCHINFGGSGNGVVVIENLTGTNVEVLLHGISYVAE